MMTWFLLLGLAIALLGGGVWLFLRLANNTAYSAGYTAGEREAKHRRDVADYQRGYNMALYGTETEPTIVYVANWPQLQTIDAEVVK